MNHIDQRDQPLTLAEIIAALCAATTAALVFTAYWVDTLGWHIDSLLMLLAVMLEVLASAVWLRRQHRHIQVRIDGKRLAGFVGVTIGFLAYLFALAGPFLLPPTGSSDMVQNLNLINYISLQRQLVHSTVVVQYLGEMIAYFPGGHLITALASIWLNIPPVRLLFPVVAGLVALKIGFVYNTILRILPASRINPAVAAAGTALLLMAWAYFIVPVTIHFYYAHVLSETFAVAMLWAMVRFHQQPSKSILFLWGLFGTAVILIYPVWLPVPVASLITLIWLNRTAARRTKIQQTVIALAPLGFAGLAYLIDYVKSYQGQLIKNEGAVILPSPVLYGFPFLILASIGIIGALRQQRSLPITITFSWAIFQPVALLIGAANHVNSFYAAFKSFHIFLYPLAISAASGLDFLWASIGKALKFKAQKTWRIASAVLPVFVVISAISWGLPLHMASAVTPDIYEVGKWAKGHLPNGCIDYAVSNWVTAFYLHVNALGNPALSARSDQIVGDASFQATPPVHVTDSGALPFVIVENVLALPDNLPANSPMLYRVENAAVLQRVNAAPCINAVAPLDQAVFTQTLQSLPEIFR